MAAPDPTGDERRDDSGTALVPRAVEVVAVPLPAPAEPVTSVAELPARVRAARWIAVAADVVQILVVPAFFEGVLSPVNDVLDVVVAVVMLSLLGWHPALLPAFVAELVPFVDLLPTWTAAVLFVTRRRT
jgi:hypothetical protein